MTHGLEYLTTFFPLLLVGVMLPFLGRNRRGILFGVTVPLDFADSPQAHAALQRYRRNTAALALVALAVAGLVVQHSSADAALYAGVLGQLSLLAGGFLLWRRERNLMRAHETTVPLERRAELAGSANTLPIACSVAALLPLAAVALYLHSHWNLIPATWPQHWSTNGRINQFGTRDFAGVYTPLLAGAILVLLMTLISLFLGRASGGQQRQRALALAPLAALTWMLAAMFSVIGLLPLLQPVTATASTDARGALSVAVVAIVAWLVFRTGMASGTTSEPYDGTPDSMWHAGIFYYNPADAAVLVPKRFGWGWTLNFARPASWLYIGGVVAGTALLSLIPHIALK